MQQNTSNWETTLVSLGIELGLLVSGFFGALMMVSKRSAQKVTTTIISVIAGTACANYLTPVAIYFLPDTVKDGRGKYAAAFVMGFLGLKGLELIVDKWFGEGDSNNKCSQCSQCSKKFKTMLPKKPKIKNIRNR